jgi:hypothetical protein
MADAPAFDWVCSELERRTSLDRLEARGTVRLALKQAGLDSRSLSPDQMRVVLEKVMPKELASRGVQDAEGVCRALASGVSGVASAAGGAESPEDVFRRLAGAPAR